MARIFLALVGVAYLFLAGWCAVSPDKTSKAIGFSLQPGAGQSEYFTVYGGLQFALGLTFLWPLYRPADTEFSLILCLLIHGCLVAFRTISFGLYGGIPTMTYGLAATEWAIFLGAAAIFWGKR